MPKATWNGATLAETDSDAVRIVEGSVYFPPECVDHTYLRESKTRTVCPVKGIASYYDLVVEGEANRDAAWFYAAPKPEAEEIAGYVAFWKGVTVEQDD
ncbi:MAG: DUF427 domain-containing protein [Betaproteobacteria bacterium]|nr:MAG: DUF427 domain-containing protein [Betaproteobacteria bacterium]